MTEIATKTWYIHKHEVHQQYGGTEEGGWWFEVGIPVEGFRVPQFADEESAYRTCRSLNKLEYERRDKEEKYEFTSVLSYLSNHYAYTVVDFEVPQRYPLERPHYE